MRKLLSLFSALTIIGTAGASLTACDPANGNTVPFYIYNNASSTIDHKPDAKGDTNNLYDASINTDDYQFQAAMGVSSYQLQISLNSNLLVPLLTGVNLSSDNTKNTDGAKWSDSQIKKGLSFQKNYLINVNPTWKDLFADFSSQADTYFTQVALLKINNTTLFPTNGSLISKVANPDKANDKNSIDTNQVKPSLYALTPVAQAESFLSANYLLQKSDTNNFLNQNAAYALLSMGDLHVTFEFTGLHHYWSFDVILHNIAARFQFAYYPDPNNSGDTKNYLHQWFFTGYDFYDKSNFSNAYASGQQANNVLVTSYSSPNIGQLAIGYVNAPVDPAQPKNTNYAYLNDPTKDIVKNAGMFSHDQIPNADNKISFPWLDWDIQPLITENNK